LAKIVNNTARNKKEVFISFRDLKQEEYKHKIISLLQIMIPFYLEKGLKIHFFYQVASDEEFNTLLYHKFMGSNIVFSNKCMKYDEISNYNSAK